MSKLLLTLIALSFSAVLQAGEISDQSWNELHLDKLNQSAPVFAVTYNKTLSNFQGQWVLLHFWATWCSPCRKELPELERLYSRCDSKKVAFITVSIDEEHKDKVTSFIHSLDLKLPVVFGMDANISRSYWNWGVPVTYLINPKGKIIARALGPRDWDSVAGDKLIASLSITDKKDTDQDPANIRKVGIN